MYQKHTISDLIFKLSPKNSSDIDIELRYNGTVVFNKTNSSDRHYTSFSTTGLTPTIKITDSRNGGNSVLTNLFTFNQINISGTGYFETVNDVINLGLTSDDVKLRYDSLDVDYTSTSNEAIGIDFNAQSLDNYIVTKTVNGTLVETRIVEETDPILTSTNPSDNATAVAVGSHIVLNFSEAVDLETGNIVIYKSADNSIAETIDVTSNRVKGSGTNQITINPSSNLSSNTGYYLQLAATAFDDVAGNSYAGITDTTSLSFTTGDFTNPSFGSVSIYVIGRHLYLITFRNSNIFNDIVNQTFKREIISGAIDLSAFTV